MRRGGGRKNSKRGGRWRREPGPRRPRGRRLRRGGRRRGRLPPRPGRQRPRAPAGRSPASPTGSKQRKWPTRRQAYLIPPLRLLLPPGRIARTHLPPQGTRRPPQRRPRPPYPRFPPLLRRSKRPRTPLPRPHFVQAASGLAWAPPCPASVLADSGLAWVPHHPPLVPEVPPQRGMEERPRSAGFGQRSSSCPSATSTPAASVHLIFLT